MKKLLLVLLVSMGISHAMEDKRLLNLAEKAYNRAKQVAHNKPAKASLILRRVCLVPSLLFISALKVMESKNTIDNLAIPAELKDYLLALKRDLGTELMGYLDRPVIAESIISCRPELTLRNERGETALISALKRCHTETAHRLIEAGADVNSADKQGNTALISLAKNRYHLGNEFDNIARQLVAAGADLNAKDKRGLTASDYRPEIPEINELLGDSRIIDKFFKLLEDDPNIAAYICAGAFLMFICIIETIKQLHD